MRELSVELFSTLDGYGDGGPQSAPYWGYGGPGLFEWMHAKLAEEHIMVMGATSYRMMSKIVAEQDDPTFPRMAELRKIVFSKTLTESTWANTTIVDEPVETAMPKIKAEADGLPLRTVGSPSLVRSLFKLGLVDRIRTMIFPTIHGTAGEGPLYTELPDLRLDLDGTAVIDDRLVLLDYRVDRS
ncbi:dihydrofolate reductase family protein [Amycolatopsis sp. 195334CR]|uniref:dihydrofolate reductase family protein n=1 Tax=Amycolatopsis sp. 195334CR TaxID=2814588 RepID=UPI001A8C31E1|nr:dihydrofolate reductase family protein [Amycolatopsis sp. 195334CR]MBN6034018.1 dihydrofolate reductase family protein [Amycolatopsis sp. 195334CR]